MKLRPMFMALIVGLTAMSAAAQLPPGKWWRRPEVIRVLNLTEEQQSRLDQTFRSAANELIDMKAEVEKQNVALRGELEQPQPSRQAIQKIAAKLNDARGRLFERELMMFVDMRAVLTEQQWVRMRTHLDQMREEGGRLQRKPEPMRRRP